jgi:hypothetical protein
VRASLIVLSLLVYWIRMGSSVKALIGLLMNSHVLAVHAWVLVEVMMVLLESINLVDEILIFRHEVLVSVCLLSFSLAKESSSSHLNTGYKALIGHLRGWSIDTLFHRLACSVVSRVIHVAINSKLHVTLLIVSAHLLIRHILLIICRS